MDLNFFLAGVMGFGPAVALMWYALRKYSYPYTEKSYFDDRKVFLLLAVGMVVGVVVAVIEAFLYPSFRNGEYFVADLFILIYVAGFSIVEEMAKLAVLNFPRLRKRFDAVFYGVSFGAGFSAVWVMQGAYRVLGPSGIPEASWFFATVVFSFALVLLHVSTGAMIGAACAAGKPWPALAKAIGIHAFVNLMMMPFFYLGELWFSAPLMLAVCAFVYMDVHRKIVPGALPPEALQELRRGARRRERDGG